MDITTPISKYFEDWLIRIDIYGLNSFTSKSWANEGEDNASPEEQKLVRIEVFQENLVHFSCGCSGLGEGDIRPVIKILHLWWC